MLSADENATTAGAPATSSRRCSAIRPDGSVKRQGNARRLAARKVARRIDTRARGACSLTGSGRSTVPSSCAQATCSVCTVSSPGPACNCTPAGDHSPTRRSLAGLASPMVGSRRPSTVAGWFVGQSSSNRSTRAANGASYRNSSGRVRGV